MGTLLYMCAVRCAALAARAQLFGSVQAGPTFLIGPPWTMPHGVELQPGLQPCAPSGTHVRAMGDALSRWGMCRLADACLCHLKQSVITALTSADLQRKDGL